jgi:hypothetical protein
MTAPAVSFKVHVINSLTRWSGSKECVVLTNLKIDTDLHSVLLNLQAESNPTWNKLISC